MKRLLLTALILAASTAAMAHDEWRVYADAGVTHSDDWIDQSLHLGVEASNACMTVSLTTETTYQDYDKLDYRRAVANGEYPGPQIIRAEWSHLLTERVGYFAGFERQHDARFSAGVRFRLK